MPKVVIYVPAAKWRELEAGGVDPAEFIRSIAKMALTADFSAPASTATVIPIKTPKQAVKVVTASKDTSSTGCFAYAPRGTKCKLCGKIH